jgi:phosphoribosylglycinamide formyltransferase-1
LSSEGIHIAILVSGHGRGSNLQAIVNGCSTGRIRGKVSLVIGTRGDAPAMERARDAGVKTAVISPKDFEGNEEAYGEAILHSIRLHAVDLICLAGYMRILPLNVVDAFRNRIMNVHPALLPKFGGHGMYGPKAHEAVIASGETETGATVHFVDEHYDTGPIIVQKRVAVEQGDTAESLAERVLPAEHEAYVEAIHLYAEGRIKVESRTVTIVRDHSVVDSSNARE